MFFFLLLSCRVDADIRGKYTQKFGPRRFGYTTSYRTIYEKPQRPQNLK